MHGLHSTGSRPHTIQPQRVKPSPRQLLKARASLEQHRNILAVEMIEKDLGGYRPDSCHPRIGNILDSGLCLFLLLVVAVGQLFLACVMFRVELSLGCDFLNARHLGCSGQTIEVTALGIEGCGVWTICLSAENADRRRGGVFSTCVDSSSSGPDAP